MYQFYVTEDCLDEQLQTYWNEVSRTIKDVSFVQYSEWFNAYLKSELDSSFYFCFVVFLRDKKPVAVFPLQYRITSRFGFPVRTWWILPPRELMLNDFVFEPSGENSDILSHLVKYLNTRRDRPWDLLELKHCRENGSVDWAMRHSRPLRSVSIFGHYSKYLVCRSEEDNSIAKRSAKFRRNLRRLWKKLREKGEVTTHFYCNISELHDALEEFIEVESAGWKAESKTALKYNDGLRSFYRAIIDTFGQSGSCVIHTMKLDGRPIASQLSVISGKTYNMLKIGYDEEFKVIGPGALLLDETVSRFSKDEAIDTISFVTGSGWADKWDPEALYVKNHYIYNRTIKGMACYFIEKSKEYLRILKEAKNQKQA